MDAAAPKLDLEGVMSLRLIHSGPPRPSALPNPGTGSRHNMLRVVEETSATRALIERASLPLSAGQPAEGSFIGSPTHSDCDGEGFLATELLWPSIPGPLSPWLPGSRSAFKT